jgi:hypothetical protein
MTVPTQTSRTVAGVINSVETLEGAGFLVRRPFPKSSFSEFDPFLHKCLSELRIKLLHLHKLLLETERLTYEKVRGQVSRGELLQLVISHEQFA